MRIIVRIGVMTAALLTFGVPEALANSPATSFNEDISGDVIGPCVNGTYTVLSGSIKITLHEGAAASGNSNFTVTLRASNVVLQDDAGDRYSMRGAISVGGAVNNQSGAEVVTATHSLQVVGQGKGVVDAVRFFERIRNGELEVLDFSTCEF